MILDDDDLAAPLDEDGSAGESDEILCLFPQAEFVAVLRLGPSEHNADGRGRVRGTPTIGRLQSGRDWGDDRHVLEAIGLPLTSEDVMERVDEIEVAGREHADPDPKHRPAVEPLEQCLSQGVRPEDRPADEDNAFESAGIDPGPVHSLGTRNTILIRTRVKNAVPPAHEMRNDALQGEQVADRPVPVERPVPGDE